MDEIDTVANDQADKRKMTVVMTTINAPNEVMKRIASRSSDIDFIIIGDQASPPSFTLPGSDYLNINEQLRLGFDYVGKCPLKHYARKNIGYLLAMRRGAEIIL